MLHYCFASFKQSLLDFFKLVDSRLMFMLLSVSGALMMTIPLIYHLCLTRPRPSCHRPLSLLHKQN